MQDMNYAQSLANKLLTIKAIKLSPKNPFTWASGIQSPIYCDNRITLSHPEVRNYIKQGFVDLIKSKYSDTTVIVGVATAGIPHGALIADALSLPFVYVRSSSKGHGRKNIIEGELPENAKAVVIEDLISTGGSSLKAVQVLEDLNVEVFSVLSIFTYNLGVASENFRRANCSYFSLTNYPSLLNIALESGFLDKEDYNLLVEWYKSPEEWSKQFASK